MNNINKIQLNWITVKALGLDPDAVNLESIEAIACSLRRASGFLCPCSARTLIHAVVEPLREVSFEINKLEEVVEDVLEALIAHGDLFELVDLNSENNNSGSEILYLAPPSFIKRKSSALIVLGILPDNISMLPSGLEKQMEYFNHVRILPPSTEVEREDQLLKLGFLEIPITAWLKTPTLGTAREYLNRINTLMQSAPRAGDIPGLRVVNPKTSVRYYRARWTTSGLLTGNFVGRRPQAYGADLWCYVELKDGLPVKLLDLPLKSGDWRSWDEAWCIQTAIDFENGTPQEFEIKQGPSDSKIINFFSPLPSWIIKKLELVGEPVSAAGCLFSYKFRNDEIAEEIQFLTEKGWLFNKVTK